MSARIGILGAGQLGRMLALAGYPLGLRFRFLDPLPGAPAGELAEQIVGGYEDAQTLTAFAAGLDLITYEFENVPVAAVRQLARLVPVYPPPEALAAAQDRLAEKSLFQELGLPTPAFAAVETLPELEQAVHALGLPAVLKTRRLGYDGKGQFTLRQAEDLPPAWRALGGAPLILERFIPFERELSVLAARGRDGSAVTYPLVENHHQAGMLRLSLAPAPGLTAELQAQGEEYIGRVMRRLNYVGVLALELFQHQGQLIANEMAPRVHNSGHWTIEGAVTSQFANHLRAGLGWPLGEARANGWAAMLNLIGTLPDPASILAVPGAYLHVYGKAPRAGRKLGHITVTAEDAGAVQERAALLKHILDR